MPAKTEPNVTFLQINPGNMVRKKAICIDLSDFNQIKTELEPNFDTQMKLRQQQRGTTSSVNGQRGGGSSLKGREKLITMTKLNRNLNSSLRSRPLLKQQTIRNIEKKVQPNGLNQTEREQMRLERSKEEETSEFVREIFSNRKSSISKSKFVPALSIDPSIHPKAHKEKSLSPNAKLRLLKA